MTNDEKLVRQQYSHHIFIWNQAVLVGATVAFLVVNAWLIWTMQKQRAVVGEQTQAMRTSSLVQPTGQVPPLLPRVLSAPPQPQVVNIYLDLEK